MGGAGCDCRTEYNVPELKNARVWYDPNTGRLQVTIPAEPWQEFGALDLKHVTLRVEYGHGSSREHSIKAYPRRRGDASC